MKRTQLVLRDLQYQQGKRELLRLPLKFLRIFQHALCFSTLYAPVIDFDAQPFPLADSGRAWTLLASSINPKTEKRL